MSSLIGYSLLRRLSVVPKELSAVILPVRNYRNRFIRPALYDFNQRQGKINKSKKLLNESEYSRRALFSDWNYDVELFALGARLRESFNFELVREALRDPTLYLVSMKEKIDLSLKDSEASYTRLVELGREVISASLNDFLTKTFPKVPSDGIIAFQEYLMSPYVLASKALHIGLKDLVVSQEYPPSKNTLSNAFCALIGAHSESGNNRRQSYQLVVDLVATQIIGMDLHDVWKIQNPMDYLSKILAENNMKEPEPRLQWASGKNTLLASYHVGIYSNQSLIGECTGESIETARDMAALDTLRRMFDTDLSKRDIFFHSNHVEPSSLES
uniref:Large ribosomal subunit protein mL44 n=1 Tax=Lepeophtheirus salmonis TaxID=72036 RepID=C1BV26_LEPSM|nr:39S ribosomal protein L44, mitochondrial precursor [Lepeophtheirus salmonis]